MPNNRKPAHLEYVGGKSPRQQIWEKIRELKQFTMNGLVKNLPGTINRDTTRTYVKSLEAGGYLNFVSCAASDGSTPGIGYHLIRDNGVEAPRLRKDGTEVTQGREQENIWRTLRTIKHPVQYRELAALASTESHAVSPAFARDYLVNLYKAGYVTRNDSKPFKGSCKYVLIPAMNTGPRPPMIQRIKQVYDPNLGKVIWTDSHGDDDE